jgi:hypothetical protein
VPERGQAEGEAADAIGLRFSHDGGAYFGSIMLARSPGDRLAADPAIANLPNGAFLVTWLAFRAKPHGEAYDMRVVATVARPGDIALGALALVTSDEPDHEYDRPWSTVTARGTLVVVYRSAFRGDAGISVAKGVDGVTWSRRELFSRFQFAGGLATTCAATGADHVYVAYYDPSDGIVLRTSHDDATTFPDERVVSTKSENVALEAPSCVAAGEEVAVAYGIGQPSIDTGASPALLRVIVARSHDAGRTFDTRAPLEEPGRELVHPRLARVAGGRLGVLALTTSGQLVFHREPFGSAGPRLVLRDGLHVGLRRSDRAWGGDYLGFAASQEAGGEGGRAYAAFVDARPEPRVAFLSFTP